MTKLSKNGLVREAGDDREVTRLLESGYEIMSGGALEGVEQEPAALTIPQLVKLCKEKGIEIPKGTKKKEDFIALLNTIEEEQP